VFLLAKELQDGQIRVLERGQASFNARQGAHDDLVIALRLSVGTEPQVAKMQVVDYLNAGPTLEEQMEQRDAVRKRFSQH
jgi:hypothetical protein